MLVIGVGSELRGDDGAGPAVVEAVQSRDPPGVRTLWAHQLVPELAERIATATRVIFVDAVVATGSPEGGRGDRAVGLSSGGGHGVQVRRVVAGPPSIGGHHGDPGALLGLAALAGLPLPEAFLVTVPAHDLALAVRLSPATRAAVAVAVALVLRLSTPEASVPVVTGS